MMAEGVVVAASAGENATASFWRESRLCGGHTSAGGEAVCVGVVCEGGFVCWRSR